jgi:hypothetical protein
MKQHAASIIAILLILSPVGLGSAWVFAESPLRTATHGKKVATIKGQLCQPATRGLKRMVTDFEIDVTRVEEVLKQFDNIEPSDDKSGDVEEIVKLSLQCDDNTSLAIVVGWSAGKEPLKVKINDRLYKRASGHWKLNDDAGSVFTKIREMTEKPKQ